MNNMSNYNTANNQNSSNFFNPSKQDFGNNGKFNFQQNYNPSTGDDADGLAEKVVKDQNLLNSDDKLFENMVNNSFCLKTIFDGVSISEKHAGTTLFKAMEKLCYNNKVQIINQKKKDEQEVVNCPSTSCLNPELKPTTIELVRIVVNDFVENHNIKSGYADYLDEILLSNT